MIRFRSNVTSSLTNGEQVISGTITIQAEASKPYALYKKKAAPNPIANWGEGTPVKDPGFNNGNLKYWNVKGSGVAVVRNKYGQYEVVIHGVEPVTISQTVPGLKPGKYYASVYVSTEAGRKATLGVNNYGGPEVTNYANSSLWKNLHRNFQI